MPLDHSEQANETKTRILLEYEALLKFYHATNGPLWKRKDGWNLLEDKINVYESILKKTDDGLLPLHGVTWEKNHVIVIDLSANNLSGRLPKEMVHLRYLKTLKLRNNLMLHGKIPSGMYTKMKHLRYCYLDGCGFEEAVPFDIAHDFEITQFRSQGAVVRYQTRNDETSSTSSKSHNPRQAICWLVDITESDMLAIHTALKQRHPKPDAQEEIHCNAHNATGPERVAAAIKLQRIYRARIERRKFRAFLRSLYETKYDKQSGYTYFVNTRTGESTWERPQFAQTPRSSQQEHQKNDKMSNQQADQQQWQVLDDGYGNTYYYNQVTGESTWEPPVFLSRIYQELRERYGEDKTDEERFELFFQSIDKDGTGDIDQDEFTRLCGDLGMVLSIKQVQKIFEELDTSRDGLLSRQEIFTWLTRNY